MRNQLFLMLACTGLALSSCNDGQEESVLQNEGKGNVLITIDPFESANATRTNCDPNNDYAITWADGDVVGIFPREGYQEPFEIPAGQIGQKSASFDGGYWALRSGLTYNAYYPFNKANFESADCKTTIPVTYLGQSQTGTACNVGAYDYTYSDWTSYEGTSINFKFHHIGSFLVLKLPVRETASYQSLSINVNDAIIPTYGTYDLTESTPNFKANNSSLSKSLTLTLSNCSLTAGQEATFYMMMPVVDLSDQTLIAKLTSSSGDIYEYQLPSTNFEKGALKEISSLNSLNGHEYVDLGIKDSNGKTIFWATNNLGVSEEYGYGDYIAWGETTGYLAGKIDFQWSTYKYCSGTQYTMTKYCSTSTYGTVDNKTQLESADDAASIIWGEKWHIPTFDEMQELKSSCTWTWVDASSTNGFNGYAGYKVSKKNDSSAFIFLPAAGMAGANAPRYSHDCFYSGHVGTDGYYMTSTIFDGADYQERVLYFSSTYYGFSYSSSEGRAEGLSIRPVCCLE